MTDAETVIRGIRPTDRAGWARLFVAYGVFYETAFTQEIVDAVFENLTDATTDVQAIVAERDDTLIGFAHFRRQYDTFTAGPGWYLDDLFVSPEARGSGAATALIDALRELAAGNGGGTVRWITAEDNTTAQRVYDRVAKRTTWVTYEMES
jgi:GNAT superfamily N-acetyltransferase